MHAAHLARPPSYSTVPCVLPQRDFVCATSGAAFWPSTHLLVPPAGDPGTGLGHVCGHVGRLRAQCALTNKALCRAALADRFVVGHGSETACCLPGRQEAPRAALAVLAVLGSLSKAATALLTALR